MLMFKKIVVNILVALLCVSALSVAASDAKEYANVTSDKSAAVASVNPIATQIGLGILEQGGNAVDAAVAVAFALGVVDSHNSGIGGGCFILLRKADGSVVAIDGREVAPALAHRDMFVKDGEVQKEWSKTGALAIGVPGSVAALYEVQKQAGNLSFKDVVMPSVKIAEEGVKVDNTYAARLAWMAPSLSQFPATAKVLLNKKGKPWLVGETVVQKDLAKTYRKLARHGPKYFYRGKFAKAVDKWMKQNKGFVRYSDFKNYTIKARLPVKSRFGDYTFLGFPPPSSGGVHVAQILNILSHFDLAILSEVDRYHLLIETMKLAFADRAYWLGDPAFANVPRGLISREYAARLAKKVSLEKVIQVPQHNIPLDFDKDIFGKHTTHLATADKQGNWVAITTTLNTSFGSKVMIPGTGVLMNNQMDDFSSQPGVPNAFGLVGTEANSVQPGKRPLSSMSPTIVLKGEQPVLTLGAAGGPTIITQVVQAALNYLVLNMPLEQAMATPRVHHQWKPEWAFIDGYASEELKAGLEKRGHKLKIWPPFGSTQAIAINAKGELVAQSEPRLITRNKK